MSSKAVIMKIVLIEFDFVAKYKRCGRVRYNSSPADSTAPVLTTNALAEVLLPCT